MVVSPIPSFFPTAFRSEQQKAEWFANETKNMPGFGPFVWEKMMGDRSPYWIHFKNFNQTVILPQILTTQYDDCSSIGSDLKPQNVRGEKQGNKNFDFLGFPPFHFIFLILDMIFQKKDTLSLNTWYTHYGLWRTIIKNYFFD